MQWLIDIISEKVLKHFTGIVVAWSGTLDNIPAGWALCDGTNCTPNLSDKFIKSTLIPGTEHDTGGAYTHTHPFTTDGHTHLFVGPPDIAGGHDLNYHLQSATDSGTTDSINHLPPWYKLCYIMKL